MCRAGCSQEEVSSGKEQCPPRSCVSLHPAGLCLGCCKLSQPHTLNPVFVPHGGGEDGLPHWSGGWLGRVDPQKLGSGEVRRENSGTTVEGGHFLEGGGKLLPGILGLSRGRGVTLPGKAIAPLGQDLPQQRREKDITETGRVCPMKECLAGSEHLQDRLAPCVATLKVFLLMFNWNFLIFHVTLGPPVPGYR